MKKNFFRVLPILINIFFLLVVLFLSNFNLIKVFVFILIILHFLYFFYFLYLNKEELIIKKKNIYDVLNIIFNNLENGIVFYDDNFLIKYVNQSFVDFCKVSKDSLKNFKIDTWIVKNENYNLLSLIFFPALTAEKINIVKNAENIDIIEVNYKGFFIKIITSFFIYDKEKINFKIIIDNSKEIQYQKSSLQLLDMLAHHLRTPLNQIKWILESLNIKDAEDKKMIDDALYIINKSIILSQIIILSNKTQSQKINLNIEKNNVLSLINELMKLFNYSLKEKMIKTEISVDKNVEEFYFDKNILFFVLYPIIENAIDYNKENGLVKIEVSPDYEKHKVKIIISDTGIGFSKEDLEHIFEKYYRGEGKKLKPSGFGLGLYLANYLAKIHKGQIYIKSEKNKGTDITLELPINQSEYQS
jgi:two-component system, OmpR family, phosphate regulon sensor histidine kinase PhoR